MPENVAETFLEDVPTTLTQGSAGVGLIRVQVENAIEGVVFSNIK